MIPPTANTAYLICFEFPVILFECLTGHSCCLQSLVFVLSFRNTFVARIPVTCSCTSLLLGWQHCTNTCVTWIDVVTHWVIRVLHCAYILLRTHLVYLYLDSRLTHPNISWQMQLLSQLYFGYRMKGLFYPNISPFWHWILPKLFKTWWKQYRIQFL